MSFTYKYPRPSLTVDAILINKSEKPQILLIQRKNDPYKNYWAFPGGFLDMDENLVTAAHRELKEETGITVGELKQLGIYDAIDRDPRGRTISVAFYTFVDTNINAIAQDDAKDAKWFPLNELPNLAFDHAQIIKDLLNII